MGTTSSHVGSRAYGPDLSPYRSALSSAISLRRSVSSATSSSPTSVAFPVSGSIAPLRARSRLSRKARCAISSAVRCTRRAARWSNCSGVYSPTSRPGRSRPHCVGALAVLVVVGRPCCCCWGCVRLFSVRSGRLASLTCRQRSRCALFPSLLLLRAEDEAAAAVAAARTRWALAQALRSAGDGPLGPTSWRVLWKGFVWLKRCWERSLTVLGGGRAGASFAGRARGQFSCTRPRQHSE